MVFHVAPAQRGKSRLFQATDILFETADDILEDKARQHAQTFREGDGAAEGEIAFLVKSISVQSCTPTEFFFRCSADFPQCRAGYICSSWKQQAWGQAFNVDEAYEFMENFSLMGAAPKISASSERSVINSHASTLNTLVAQGRTKRATRTSTSYGEGVKSKHISLSVLGNGHPSKFIGMERGLIGNHTACTKECFLIVVDTSVARHDALPPHADVPDAQRWTWLPLTSLQATIFGWEDVLNNPAGWKGIASDGTDDAEDAEASEEGIETEGPLRGYPMTLPDG
ncbi:DUF3510 domain-containing protein, partial [Durusdinium trenchii]